jgi:phosphate transport system substrate-binding protein
MRTGRHALTLGAAAASLALLAAACGGDNGDGGTTEPSGPLGLTGTVAISGSSTVQPISSLIAELFNGNNPDVTISVDGPGTGDGFALFCNDEIDISDASRQISDDEIAACQAKGIDYIELAVAYDGITVMTNPANDAVTCLDTKDIYALIGPESEGFATWSDANGLAAEVGATHAPYPDVPLVIVGPGEESGTYDSFIALTGMEDLATERGVPEDQAAATRPDYQSSPNDNVIIQGIEETDSSLGWVGFAFAQEAADQVKELEVDGGSGCVAPTAETIADGSYPLARTLYIYVNTAKADSNAAVKGFVDFYTETSNLTDSVSEAGYVPLPEDQISATQAAWSSAGGSSS